MRIPGLHILDKYILKKFLTTFFFAIVILAVIACVIDYSQKVDSFVRNKAPVSAVAFYFLNFIPHITALLFPLFIFVSTIFFTSKMAYKTEVIASLAAGVSFQRFLRPYIVGSVLLGIFSLLVNHFVVPKANKNINVFYQNYINDKRVSSDNNVHLRLSPELYIYVENYNYRENSGRRFTMEKVKGTLLLEKIMAESISYDSTKKEWTLTNVKIRTNNGLIETFTKKDKEVRKIAFTPKDLDVDGTLRETMTTPELITFIEQEKLRGRESVNIFLIERYKRTAQPVAGIILTLIGACIASRKVRGGSGLHLAIGILGCAIYMLLLQFTQTFSLNAGLNPFIAVWIPNAIFAFVAVYFLRKQIK